jgi:hypothetical protein
LALYLLALLQDLRSPAVIGIGGCDIAQGLMIDAVIVMVDEGGDLLLEIAGQVVIFEQDAPFQRLVPPLDFALRLRKERCAKDMLDVFARKPFCQITGDVEPPII